MGQLISAPLFIVELSWIEISQKKADLQGRRVKNAVKPIFPNWNKLFDILRRREKRLP